MTGRLGRRSPEDPYLVGSGALHTQSTAPKNRMGKLVSETPETPLPSLSIGF